MKYFYLLVFCLVSTSSVHASAHSDSINIGWDSMDKIHQKLSEKSADLKTQIDEAGKKIEAAKAAQEKKPNYWLPIIGGAILGIGLAVWLRRKK